MANFTPAKKPKTSSRAETDRPNPCTTSDVSGFVHNVSPLKLSDRQRLYFIFKLQTDRDEYLEGVCFSPEKRRYFMSVQSSKSPRPRSIVKDISKSSLISTIILMRINVLLTFLFTKITPEIPQTHFVKLQLTHSVYTKCYVLAMLVRLKGLVGPNMLEKNRRHVVNL